MRRNHTLRLHKPTGQGFVEIAGKRIYLGRFDLPETHERYHRFMAEYHAGGGQPPPDGHDVSVNELILRFYRWALSYYAKPGRPRSGEAESIRLALHFLRELYGSTPAKDFGPLALKAVREKMISTRQTFGKARADKPRKEGNRWSRTHINAQISRIKRCFRWGAENELVPGETWHALQAVRSLAAGRSEARETEAVKPVPLSAVEAVTPHLPRQVRAMVQLQLLTAARPGEIVSMRPCDIERPSSPAPVGGSPAASPAVWVYRPVTHKTAYRGHGREIYLGPEAQAVLAPFLSRVPAAFCFSPREAMEEWRAARHAARKTPESCGNTPGSNRKRRPAKQPGERYTTLSYAAAISRACVDANVEHWHPHQLRHAAATRLRKLFDLETARVVLGHRSADVTEVYAEVDRERAARAVERVG